MTAIASLVETEAPRIHVFTDKDGVLAGFEQGFYARFKRYFDEVPVGVAWKLINGVNDFYEKLPHHTDVQEYWKEARKVRPTILTGCPNSRFELHEACKRAWTAANPHFDDGTIFLRDTPEIVCLTKDKPQHMVNPGDLLIDDHQKNGDKWMAAGGRFILFRHARQAAAELRDMVAELKHQGHRFNDE